VRCLAALNWHARSRSCRRQSKESTTLSALKVVFGFRDYNERHSAGVLCPQRCVAGTVLGQFHSSARNFIKAQSSRQRRFLGR
jgi:hypothetical protein